MQQQNIMSGIVRGGQTSFHGLRMFGQVFSKLSKWSLFIWLALFLFMWIPTVTQEQMIAYFDYRLASFLSAVGFDRPIAVHYYGTPWDARPSVTMNMHYFIEIAHKVHKNALSSIIFASKVTGLLFVILCIFLTNRGRKKSGQQHLRGATLLKSSKLKKKLSSLKNLINNPYKIADFPYQDNAECSHTLVIGSTGCGKSTLISQLLEQIRAKGDKAIVFDRKGEFLSHFYDSSKDIILNPFDERSVSWNILLEIEHLEQIENLAECFVPEKTYYQGEKIWGNAAKIAFVEIVNQHFKEDLTNRDIANILLKESTKKLASRLKNTFGGNVIDPSSPQTAASVVFTIANHFRSLKIHNTKKKESFSIRNWCRASKDSFTFIGATFDTEASSKALQTALFEVAISAVLSNHEDNKQKTWFILDELATLERIPSLQKALSLARSYGGCFVLGIQNISQMRDIYGQNGTQSISAECNTRCLFRTNDPETAEWISKSIGMQETQTFNEGLSYGANEIRDGVTLQQHEKTKPLVLASEIQNMPNLELFLKLQGQPITKTTIKYKERQKVAKGFVQKVMSLEEQKYLKEEDRRIDEEIEEVEEESEDEATDESASKEKKRTETNTDNKPLNGNNIF